MSEESIVIYVDLCINAVDILIGGDRPGVDFDLGCVHLQKHFIQLDHLVNGLIPCLTCNVQLVNNASCILLAEAFDNIYGVD
jgi:hypothetical protein